MKWCIFTVEGRGLLKCEVKAEGIAKSISGKASAIGSSLSESIVGASGCDDAKAKALVSITGGCG